MASPADPVSVTPCTKATSCPWGRTAAAPVTCSLEDVMSEELAKELQLKEESEIKQYAIEEPIDMSAFIDQDQVDSDFLLAQMLQHQFDSEHDELLQREENKLNGTSKVKLSFDNYRMVHPTTKQEEDECEDWDLEEEVEEEEKPLKFKNGISGKGKNIVTKHDPNLDAKKHAKKVMDFPVGFDTGDIDKGEKVRLPARVYNHLKQHSINDSKRIMKLHEKKEHSTADMAVDENTRLIMYKLVSNSVLDGINGIISTGKEAIILHANGGSMTDALVPAECAIKVFKTTLNEFKNRVKYIQGDVRFLGDNYKKQNPRRIIKIWAEKEEVNLRRLERIGVPCPKVVVLKKHVLLMSFIGQDGKPAPQLKDAKLNTVDLQMAYEQCIQNIKKMFNEGGLVHGDLSEYNMLWHEDLLYFIDVSQAVDKMHPHAMEFLLRDCTNIVNFFKKNGIPNVPSEYELFNDVTGLQYKGEGQDFLVQFQEYEKNEDKLRMDKGKNYAFDYFFIKAQEERTAGKKEEEDEEEDSSLEDQKLQKRTCHSKHSSNMDSYKGTDALSSQS